MPFSSFTAALDDTYSYNMSSPRGAPSHSPHHSPQFKAGKGGKGGYGSPNPGYASPPHGPGYASPTSTGSAGAQVLCNKIAQILKKHDGGKMAIKDVLTELHQEIGDKAPSEMNPQELAGKV